MSDALTAFRQGDVRGTYPEEINEVFVAQFAHAFLGNFNIRGKVVTGRDMRSSSLSLQTMLNRTLAGLGIEVVDIGLCATELGYFASAMPGIEAAIVVTASHNPEKYNGLKCVLRYGRAITSDSGLSEIRRLMREGYRHSSSPGTVTLVDYRKDYLAYLGGYFPPDSLCEGKLALNGLNGTAATMAGIVATEFELPVTWFRQRPGPFPEDGADPNNPSLLREMKTFMTGGDFTLGVAWDGDCDRCVCFDQQGDLIPTYYLIGLLIESHLRAAPGRAIVFDTKLCWNTLEMIERFEGIAVPSKTGHAFMKEKMRQHNAIYGGELSSHHYFGDFYGCDSGMFTWLSVLQLLNNECSSISDLIAERKHLIVITPEISIKLTDAGEAMSAVQAHCKNKALSIEQFDGLSVCMPGDWRFSVTPSKTEPVVRINFEARRTADTMLEEGLKVFDVLAPFRADDADWLERFDTL